MAPSARGSLLAGRWPGPYVTATANGATLKGRDSVRLLSWNILAGGGTRCGAILDVLRRYDPDVITLQETLPARAPDLCHALGRAGYLHRFGAPRGPPGELPAPPADQGALGSAGRVPACVVRPGGVIPPKP